MTITHQIPNDLAEQFLANSSETIPEVPLVIKKEGDFWTTVDFEPLTVKDEMSVLIFINIFDKSNK